MKTAFNQIITVMSLFFLSMTATLVISWTMTNVIFDKPSKQLSITHKIIQKPVLKIAVGNLEKSIKLLIPKIK